MAHRNHDDLPDWYHWLNQPRPGVALAIVAALVGGILWLHSTIKGPEPAEDHTAARMKGAYYAAERAAMGQLKAPSQASFAPYDPSAVTPLGGSDYAVRGTVDAPNSFGIRLRLNWGGWVTWTGPGDEDFRAGNVKVYDDN